MEGGGEELAMLEWCRKLPKVELHAHLNGSIRNSTLLELAKVLGQKGIIVFADVEHIILKNSRSLPECFKLFDLFHILTTDHETVTRITKEVVEDFAAENVIYLEIRTTPKKNEAKGMTKRSYMKAVIDGLRAINKVDVNFCDSNCSNESSVDITPIDGLCGTVERKNIYVRLLLSIDRRETTAAAMETVDLAMELKNFGVVGIDLSGNPVVGDWQTFLPALIHAKELGLPITLHCGEVPNQNEIEAMLDICPQRIGHACFLVEDNWKRVKASRTPVEICLTSNIRTESFSSIQDHHFVELYKANHPVTLCTDDCGLFSTTLSYEYYLAASTFGLNKDEMLLLARQSTEYVFAGDGVKKELTRIFEEEDERKA